MTTPRLARAVTVFHAWWEDNDWWDGNEFYVDLETAKLHAAFSYQADEYAHPDDEECEDDDSCAKPDFSWVKEHGSWHLLDHGKSTLVQVSERTVYRPATEREVQQQDALMAAERKARAAHPHLSLRQALEAMATAEEAKSA
jgi:hypothetical protein